jgi:hypothetical protein
MMVLISFAEKRCPVRGTIGSAVAMDGGAAAAEGDNMAAPGLSAKEEVRHGPEVPDGVVAAVVV